MQQPKRFQAPTLAEAYDAVRREMGESAVILSTRKAFAPGLFGQPGRQFVEVIARVPKQPVDASRRPDFEQDTAAHDLVRAVAEADATAAPLFGAMPLLTTATGHVAATMHDVMSDRDTVHADVPDPHLPQLPPAAADSLWNRQFSEMRGMLQQLMTDRLDARIEAGSSALRAMKDRLVRHGLPVSTAATVVAEAGVHDTGDGPALDTAVIHRLSAMLPPAASINTRRRALFLVGPAGTGKTTLALRLALDLERREGLHVVVAGTDVTRAGAPQQLLAVGAATGLDVRLCYTPDELTAILDEPGVDLVIVDTAGHSGLRRDRMSELSSFLDVARQRTVLFTAPATMKAADLQETLAAYSAVGVDGIAVTRCDETSHFGDVVGVMIESAIALAFTTHSEQVSDPAAAADNGILASAVVHAEWRSPEMNLSDDGPLSPARHLAKVG